jgi:hypothetical protein
MQPVQSGPLSRPLQADVIPAPASAGIEASLPQCYWEKGCKGQLVPVWMKTLAGSWVDNPLEIGHFAILVLPDCPRVTALPRRHDTSTASLWT